MRIAVNASIYDTRPSGLGSYARDLLSALNGIHPDLMVFTSRPGELPAARRIPPWGEPSRGRAGHLFRLVWLQTGLPLHCIRTRADVLLNTLPEGPWWPPAPQVTVVHDIVPLLFPREFPRHQWYFRSFIPRVLRASASVVAVSHRTREDIVHQYRLDPRRVTTVHAGVDHRRFCPRAEAADVVRQFGLRRYVLYVGNLLPHKNLGHLLDAFAMVRRDVVLAVAGYRDPRYWPALVQRAEALGIAGRVRFLDFVPGSALPYLYAAAAAVVLPSLYEGFGLPVLEAMACGAPVIASTAGGIPEATGDAALAVDPRDVSGLTAAMQQLLADGSLQADLRARGIARARQFSWDQTARSVLAVMKDAAR